MSRLDGALLVACAATGGGFGLIFWGDRFGWPAVALVIAIWCATCYRLFRSTR